MEGVSAETDVILRWIIGCHTCVIVLNNQVSLNFVQPTQIFTRSASYFITYVCSLHIYCRTIVFKTSFSVIKHCDGIDESTFVGGMYKLETANGKRVWVQCRKKDKQG